MSITDWRILSTDFIKFSPLQVHKHFILDTSTLNFDKDLLTAALMPNSWQPYASTCKQKAR